ncbi:MAG TPA: Crp/Fnr family transcriptional regulator [Terriglobales bacterium]|nr:Crp/Fnr family transcriptional regulator [Terriglobales bacterium]
MSKTASVVAKYPLDSGVSPRAHQNRLLASLPDEEFERLRPHLVPTVLGYKCPLYEANAPIAFVHFIETGVASLVNTMMNGDAAEVGTIGNEGFVGVPILFGDREAATSAFMQVGGAGLKMKANLFRAELQRSISMQRAMFHYAHAFFNQITQTAACNVLHLLEQRCCRWLLMTQDRMQSSEFPLTQEFLAMMLGVRRAGVTDAANTLKRAGLIDYTRGCVSILDRAGMEKRTCECYGVTKREFDRLYGLSPTTISK